jgi:hypothetical protein
MKDETASALFAAWSFVAFWFAVLALAIIDHPLAAH